MRGHRLTRALRARHGTSFIELLAAMFSLIVLLWGLYTVGSLYWTSTVLSTSSDVAAQSAQSAYDRWRFGASAFGGDIAADAANHQIAVREADRAAGIVLASISDQGAANGLPGVIADASCGTGTGDLVRRRVLVSRGVGGDRRLTQIEVELTARWISGLALADNLNECLSASSRTSSLRGD
ncbi:hypothetical protein [Miltoncostaea oceani]|uniref:hypothetical protein n=1 Tax=Miltoncostaea oceani TaxID=2843216 RepID=UPI001C3CDD77|nr:hypothetical protein [Miltoncostaea oceani]